MKAKTETVEYFFRLTRTLSMLLVLGTGTLSVFLPEMICNKTGWNPDVVRITTIVVALLVSNHLTKECNKQWLTEYNDLLKKDVYEIQQALKEQGRIDVEDIDWSIHVLQLIKDATNPDKDKKDEKSE